MMIEHTSTALQGAMLSTMGIVGQITVPIPDDLKSWPITAILGLIALVCLGIVTYQIRGTLKATETLAKVTERQHNQSEETKALTMAVNALVLELRGRRCLMAGG